MSAGATLSAAVAAALSEVPGLTQVADAPPVRAVVPYAVIDEPQLSDWSTKTWDGREARLTVVLHDAGERPARLRELAAAAEAAVLAIGGDIGGWRVTTVVPLRTRTVVKGRDGWAASAEYRVRMYRVN